MLTLELSEYEMSRLSDALNDSIRSANSGDVREIRQYLLRRVNEALGDTDE